MYANTNERQMRIDVNNSRAKIYADSTTSSLKLLVKKPGMQKICRIPIKYCVLKPFSYIAFNSLLCFECKVLSILYLVDKLIITD